MNLIKIGTFSISSSSVLLTDPCLEKDDSFITYLPDIEPGEWYGYVDRTEGRNMHLFATHSKFFSNITSISSITWSQVRSVIGVDSGQAGIFDPLNYHPDSAWYDAVCKLTLDTANGAGVLTGGIVSRSGYGDGGYTAFYGTNDLGHVVAIKIDFSS